MKKLIIIFVVSIFIIVGCKSVTPESKPAEVAKQDIKIASDPEQVMSAIEQAERSIEIAGQVIPFKNRFNAEIRIKIAEADEAIAEARKAYALENYSEAQTQAIKAQKASGKSLSLYKDVIDKANEELRLMVEFKIKESKKQGKDTFKAENYMQQKNYEKALEAVGGAKKVIRVGSRQRKIVWKDNLWNIAVELYGDGFKWKKIYKANKHIKNPNKIWPGQVLNLP